MSRPDLDEIAGRVAITRRAGSTLYGDDCQALLDYVAELEEERKEMQSRIAELEIYEEREMIGDPAELGGPSISSSLRARDAAQADAENTRHQLDWANERIRDLENNIRSHKRVCPMF
jgi:hypothetical protein